MTGKTEDIGEYDLYPSTEIIHKRGGMSLDWKIFNISLQKKEGIFLSYKRHWANSKKSEQPWKHETKSLWKENFSSVLISKVSTEHFSKWNNHIQEQLTQKKHDICALSQLRLIVLK